MKKEVEKLIKKGIWFMPITIWCNERSLEGECFLLPTFDQSNWRLLPAGGTRISSDFCKIINKRSVKEVLRKPCRFKMSRVILCKFGRFGELVKVFDKTTTNPITLPTPTNNSNSDFKNSISVSVEENCFWCLPSRGSSHAYTYVQNFGLVITKP